MRRACAIALLLSLPAAVQAQQQETDVVAQMQKQYEAKFNDLPPSRKCAPEDAKGIWREEGVLETGPSLLAAEQQKDGPAYLGFGARYNTLFWKRSKEELNINATLEALPYAKRQYIMTAAGMMYTYADGALERSYLCFVSTKGTNKFAEGLLMLALPIERDKPLNITLYSPVYMPK